MKTFRQILKQDKGILSIMLITLTMIFGIGIIAPHAADVMLSGKLTTVTQKVSAKGNPYTLLILPEQKELNGVKYTSDTQVLCFKDECKTLKTGDNVKFIAKKSVSKDGNEFISMVQLVK